jgi:cytochrome c-type biogenesis protein CcmH
MTLWLILALMTAAAIFAVLWPLGRRNELRADSDLAVYRAQLDEVEADRAAGRIVEADAQAARVEVSRRLIAAADAAATVSAPVAAPWRRRTMAVAVLVLLPIGAASLYLQFGSPGESGQPFAARRAALPQQNAIPELIARVEAHLAQNPEDGHGWEVLAPVYVQIGRYDEAAKALQNALRLLGANAVREADLGEALAAAAGGIVTADAKAAFQRSLAFDSGEVKARFFLGLAAEQDGNRAEAATLWRDLLAKAPANAPWIDTVRQALARAEGTAPPVPPAPINKDVAAVNELAPEQRSEMVVGMVARLAERLKNDGSNVEGWLQLLRSYMVLGERDKARAAASDARRALASEPDKLRRVEEMIKGLGLEG